jgi:hypothetical protein
MARDYLAAFAAKAADIQHKLVGGGGTKTFDESSVKRDAGGQFSSKESRKLDDVARLLDEHEAAWKKEMIAKYGKAVVNSSTQAEFNAAVPEAERDAIFKEVTKDVVAYLEESTALAEKLAKERGIRHSDFEAYVRPVERDGLWFGIKGMKWGVRRSDAEIRAAVAKKAAKGEPVTPTKTAAAVTKSASTSPKSDTSSGSETSAQRYSRLAAVAKQGGASSLSDTDLKFFNARTDAVNKVNKMYETKPGWLKTTVKDVAQNTAKQQLQALASGTADKYISGPLLAGLKGKADTAVSAPKSESPKASTTQKTAAAAKAAPSTKKAPGMSREQSRDFFRSLPDIANRPANYSPSGNFDLFKTLRDEGLIDD